MSNDPSETMPKEVYGSRYSHSGANPEITITDIDGRTFTGTPVVAFDAYLESVKGEAPYVIQEAIELRDLWISGHGYSDRALTQCASLGVQVSV